MNIINICNAVNLPKKVIVNKEIPKYILNEHIESIKYRSILERNISKVNIIADLKEDNIDIKPYYSDQELFVEIFYLFIEIKNYCELSEVFKFISEIIPYPLIIIFKFEYDFIIYMGDFTRKSDNFLKLTKMFHSTTMNEEDLRLMLNNLPISKDDMRGYYNQLKYFIMTSYNQKHK